MSALSTSIVVTFTQSSVPAAYSSYLPSAPSSVSLTCSPWPSAVTASETLWWHATAMGCPDGYSYSSAANGNTCIYTSSKSLDMTWGCDIVIPYTTTSTVSGGTTILTSGVTATRTAPTEHLTLTDEAQMTTTPAAAASPRDQTLASLALAKKWLDTSVIRPGPRNLFERQDMFQCPQNDYFCPSGTACVGDAFGNTCCGTQTLICVPYSASDIFLRNSNDHVSFKNSTTTSTEYVTMYSTVDQPSSTTIVTDTSVFTTTASSEATPFPPTTATDTNTSPTHWPDSPANPAAPTPDPVSAFTSGSATASNSTSSYSSNPASSPSRVRIATGVGVSLGLAAASALLFALYRHSKNSRAEAGKRLVSQLPVRPAEPYAGRHGLDTGYGYEWIGKSGMIEPSVRAVRRSDFGTLPQRAGEGQELDGRVHYELSGYYGH